jgi:hypothetical protein
MVPQWLKRRTRVVRRSLAIMLSSVSAQPT